MPGYIGIINLSFNLNVTVLFIPQNAGYSEHRIKYIQGILVLERNDRHVRLGSYVNDSANLVPHVCSVVTKINNTY